MTKAEINAIIVHRSKENGIDPDLLRAICTIESSLEPLAMRFEPNYRWLWFPRETASRMTKQIPGYSADTEMALQRFSYGLPQIMGAVCRELGYDGPLQLLPLEPVIVLDLACKHLKKFMEKYPSEPDWISAWNQGNAGKTPGGLYKNQSYVDKVCLELRKLRALI